jgi:hypothetical protein
MPHVGTSKMEIEPLLVTIQHTSQLIDRCNATVYGLIGAGRLEAVKSDGRTLVKMDSIKAYVDDLPKATIAPRLKRTPTHLRRQAETAIS